MENENKDLQGNIQDSEIQNKVSEDVSSKIAEAAEEIKEEIAEAAEAVEAEVDAEAETEPVYDAETGEIIEMPEEDEDELYAEPVKEPKKVTMNLSSLILSLVGTAVVGALILFGCMQIPGWVENIPEGKTAVTADGEKLTDLDMKYYIYIAANEYFQDAMDANSTSPAEYDWEQIAEEDKTAADIVKERAIEAAVGEALIVKLGDKNGAEWDEAATREEVTAQTNQLIKTYGEEIVDLNAAAQGLTNTKQYNRKIMQSEHLAAAEADLEANPEKYYPEDKSVLNDYIQEGKASVKHILISNEETAAAEGEEAAPAEDKKAKAEEILSRIKNGEDFDTLMNEFNEDPGATEAGYTFKAGEMVAPFEKAAFALKIGEVSEVVESQYGYHIILRIPGRYELEEYLKAEAKIKATGAYDKLSVADILKEIDKAAEDFQTKYAAQQQGTK